MYKTKKVMSAILGLFAIVTLAGCGGNSKSSAQKAAAPSDGNAVTVKKAEYILPKGQDTLTGEKKYLAIKVHVKNNGSTNTLYSNSFKLKNKSGSTKALSIYSSGDRFSTLSSEKLKKGDTVTGYVVFPVKKKAKYTLEVSPTSTSSKEVPTSKVKIDTGKYKDNTLQPQKAVTSYVDSVFLNKNEDDTDYNSFISNKLENEKIEYRKETRDFLETNAFNNTITDQASLKMISQIQKLNNEKGSVKYELVSYTPDTAEIKVTPTEVKLSGLSADITSFRQKVEKSKDIDPDLTYDQVDRAVKEMVIQKFPEILKQMPIREDTAQTVKLSKDGSKWKIDTEDYGLTTVRKAFIGDFY